MSKSNTSKLPTILGTIQAAGVTIELTRLYFGKFSWRCNDNGHMGKWFDTPEDARADAADEAAWLEGQATGACWWCGEPADSGMAEVVINEAHRLVHDEPCASGAAAHYGKTLAEILA